MANIFQNLIDNATFPAAKAGRAISRAKQQITREAALSVANLTSANTSANEVTVVATYNGTVSGGNFTITVNLPTRGITYTTANIAHNATAGTIEGALDTASPATVPDGDINVAASGTNLTDGNMTFTCNGSANVASMPVLITTTNVNLSGGGTLGATTRTTDGQPNRNALQALYELNIIDGTVPASGEASTDWVKPTTAPNDYIGWYRRAWLETIEFLATQLKVEEGISDNRDAVRTLYGLPEALFGPHTS